MMYTQLLVVKTFPSRVIYFSTGRILEYYKLIKKLQDLQIGKSVSPIVSYCSNKLKNYYIFNHVCTAVEKLQYLIRKYYKCVGRELGHQCQTLGLFVQMISVD